MKKGNFEISKCSLDNVDFKGNILITGNLSLQALVNVLLYEKIEKILVLDIDGKIESLFKASGLDIRYVDAAYLLKELLYSKNSMYFSDLVEIARLSFNVSLPAAFMGIEALSSNTAEAIEVIHSENIYLEAKYIVRALTSLLNSLTYDVDENEALLILSLKNLSPSLLHFMFFVFLIYFSAKVKETTAAIPVEIMKEIRYRNLVFLMTRKLLNVGDIVFFGSYLGDLLKELLLEIDIAVISGKAFSEDINIIGERFPCVNEIRKLLELGEDMVICTDNKVYIIEDFIKISEKCPPISYESYECSFSDNINIQEVKKILNLVNLSPVTKDELIIYLKNCNWTEPLKIIDELLLNKFIEEILGRDGNYWLRITPRGRLFLKVR